MSPLSPLQETPIEKTCPKGSLTTEGVLTLLGTFLLEHQSESSVCLSTSLVLHRLLVTTEVKEKQKSG